jgi:hypothetical protein
VSTTTCVVASHSSAIKNAVVLRLVSVVAIGRHVFVLDPLAAGHPNHPQKQGLLRNLSL